MESENHGILWLLLPTAWAPCVVLAEAADAVTARTAKERTLHGLVLLSC